MSKKKVLIASAITSLLMGSAMADNMNQNMNQNMDQKATPKNMEKCWGVAKKGQNDCASKAAGHSCAGQSTKDMSTNDWKNVKTGTCTSMGGKLDMPQMQESK